MKIAFLFPGQGSQSVGMGADLYAHYPNIAAILDEFNELLGYKLTTLCFYGPEDSLRKTNVTQPAIYSVSVAILSVLQAAGIQPEAVAGHSVGEYAALVAAGALTPQDGLSLVATRGNIMYTAGEQIQGAMAAILGLESDVVINLCKEIEAAGNGIVDAANINGAGQVVISGERPAVEAASEKAKELGAKRVIPLQVSGAFHSRLMAHAAESMRDYLKTAPVVNAKIPIIANVTAEYEKDNALIIENLAQQIDHSVQWESTIKRLADDGFDTFVEVGPGKVLSGIAKRMVKDSKVYTTETQTELAQSIKTLTLQG